jgi:hypothetical protein
LVVGEPQPVHPVLVVAAPQGQLPPVPLLPLLVRVPVLRLHHLVGQVEVVVHLLLRLLWHIWILYYLRPIFPVQQEFVIRIL